jgi:hypothetical protein
MSRSDRRHIIHIKRGRRATSPTSIISQHEESNTFDIPQFTGWGHNACRINSDEPYGHVFLNRNGITCKSVPEEIQVIAELKRINASFVGICESNTNWGHEHGKLRRVMLIVGCTSQDGRPAKSARRSDREDEYMTHAYL